MNERDRRAPLPPRPSPDATPRAGIAAIAPRAPLVPSTTGASPDATPRMGLAAIAPRPPVVPSTTASPDATPRGGVAALAPRAPAVPPALPQISIPQVSWSTAPPPAPPRTFSTEPPPLPLPSLSPPGRIVVQHEEEPTGMSAARLAEEVANEARAAVRVALDEALAPLHYRMRDMVRRLDELEAKVVAFAAAPAPPPPAPAAPPVVRAIAVGDPFAPAAPRAPAPAPIPVMPVVPAPPPLPRFDDYAIPSFDGRRRRRRLVFLAGALFVLVFGGLLALMLASRISATG